MNHAILRRFSALALFAALFAAQSEGATFKRRAVAHRPPPNQFSKTVSGTVIDAVTGAPVVNMQVSVGARSAFTNVAGQFELSNVAAAGVMIVEFIRSGYAYHSVRLGPSDSGVLNNVRVTPTRTATVRLTNGTTMELDVESLKFGYAVPFLGYISDDFESLCKITDSTKITVTREQIAKLTGPAQTVPAGTCCTGNADKMTLTLKNGEVMEVIFMDTCQERYTVDVIARNHVTGEAAYLPIRNIAELVFP